MNSIENPRKVLQRYGLRPKRSLGQNFLTNLSIVTKMAQEIEAYRPELVIEIGAGAGTLTQALVERFDNVLAIETDRNLVPVLEQEFAQQRDNGTVVIKHADASEFDYKAAIDTKRCAVVGNLPYHITGKLLRRIIELREVICVSFVMIQLEVAQRLIAKPSAHDYGILSVLTQAWFSPSIAFKVSPGSFHPKPKVSSAVVKLEPLETPRIGDLTEKSFAKVVKAAFSSRRKTLKNSLSSAFDKSLVIEALDGEGIDPGLRAETLTVEQFAGLARRLNTP